jgi:hypothetical protein
VTDGIFAIAMTILVFGLVIPNNTTASTLPHELTSLWTDLLSLVGNYEINVAAYSAEFARQMSELFAEDTAERFELTMDQWQSRPWYYKVSERILAPLRFLM